MNVLICWVIFPAFFTVLTGWCSVSVLGNNLGMQATKPVLFSSVCVKLHAVLKSASLCVCYGLGLLPHNRITAGQCTVVFKTFWHTVASVL
jgi:hypothetical protein